MPFGFCNAPATFERIMVKVLKGLNGTLCLVYIDDIVVAGPTVEETVRRLVLPFVQGSASGPVGPFQGSCTPHHRTQGLLGLRYWLHLHPRCPLVCQGPIAMDVHSSACSFPRAGPLPRAAPDSASGTSASSTPILAGAPCVLTAMMVVCAGGISEWSVQEVSQSCLSCWARHPRIPPLFPCFQQLCCICRRT